ncbi:diaminopimelate decarboxylase family protein [Nocardia gipuzkoensis]
MTQTKSILAAGCNDDELSDLAERCGTPLYVYNLEVLRSRVDVLKNAFGDSVTMLFATMANDQLPMLREFSKLGLGACVNSVPHLHLSQEAGFPSELTQFTSTGISSDDMSAILAAGIAVNFDSLNQLQSWFRMGGTAGGIRINAASLRGDTGDRLGMDPPSVATAFGLANVYGTSITGLHIYAGTNFQSADSLLDVLAPFFCLAEQTPGLGYVNIGGGIGVNYTHDGDDFDIIQYGEEIRKQAHRLQGSAADGFQVFVEPGRGLAANCGMFVVSVTDVKEVGGVRYVAVDGSVSVFPRPLLHPESPHRIRQLGPGPERDLPARVVGRTTYSRDILGDTLVSPEIAPGTLLAFEDAGAYCQSMISRFLGQPDVHTVFVG